MIIAVILGIKFIKPTISVSWVRSWIGFLFFLGITIHWIFKDWELKVPKEILIDFSKLRGGPEMMSFNFKDFDPPCHHYILENNIIFTSIKIYFVWRHLVVGHPPLVKWCHFWPSPNWITPSEENLTEMVIIIVKKYIKNLKKIWIPKC